MGDANAGNDKDDPWSSAWMAARQAWPSVALGLADFRRHVEATYEGLPTPEIAKDLYLAAACLGQVPDALAAFDKTYRADIHRTISRMGRRDAAVEDAQQAAYMRLFAGPAPKIGEYRGRGSLRNWLRVVVARLVVNLTTKADDEVPVEELEAFGMLTDEISPELLAMKRRYAQEFRAGLARSVRNLSAKDRSILRLAFCERMSIDRIGELYGVHRATAARWLSSSHAALVSRVQKDLRTALNVEQAEYESILRLIASELDTSLSRYLQTGEKL